MLLSQVSKHLLNAFLIGFFVVENFHALHLPTLLYLYIHTTQKTSYTVLVLLFIIAEMYTYTVSFGALYSLISRQASISFLSHLSWRSNQANQPAMTLDSTKNSRAKIYNLCTEPFQFPNAIILQTQRIFQHEHTAEKVFFESFMLGFSERCNRRFQAVQLRSQAVLFASKNEHIYDAVRYQTSHSQVFMMLSYLISFNARISFQSW